MMYKLIALFSSLMMGLLVADGAADASSQWEQTPQETPAQAPSEAAATPSSPAQEAPSTESAQSESQESSDVDSRLDSLEKEMKQVYVKNADGTGGARFAGMQMLSTDYGWFVGAELLVWHIKAGATDWVLSLNQGVLPCHGPMMDLGYNWNAGFRVGFGKNFKRDRWDLDLFYTYYRTSDSETVNGNFTTPSGTDSATNVAGPSGNSSVYFKSKVFYNAIDLSLRRAYFISRLVSLRPAVAIKTVWLDRKDRLRDSTYVNASNTITPVAGFVYTVLKDTNKLWGIGPQIGTDVTWHLPKKMRLFTTVEGALLEGYFKVRQNQTITATPTGVSAATSTVNLQGSKHQLVPYARGLVGFGWGTYVKQEKQHVDLSLSYEFNYFWRANQMINQAQSHPSDLSLSSSESVRLLLNRYSEDLGFYGISLRLELAF